MKLSEMTTAQAADAIMVIVPEIQPILLDAGLQAEFRRGSVSKEKALESGIQKLVGLVPLILGKYRENVFRILAALNGVSPEEIAAQGALVTMTQIKEALTDKELVGVFVSSAKAGSASQIDRRR